MCRARGEILRAGRTVPTTVSGSSAVTMAIVDGRTRDRTVKSPVVQGRQAPEGTREVNVGGAVGICVQQRYGRNRLMLSWKWDHYILKM